MASGVVLWAFVLLVPMLHLGLLPRLGGGELLVTVLPVVVLGLGAWLRHRLVTVVVFPLTLLPLLLAYPELTGPRVYGLGAFLALAGATVAHIYVAQAPPRSPDHEGRRQSAAQPADRVARVLTTHTVLLAIIGLSVACAIHFHRPLQELISASYVGYEGRATTFISLFFFAVWAIFIVRRVTRELAGVIGDRATVAAQWWRFEAEATNAARARSTLGWALLVGGVALSALIIVLGLLK